GGDRAAVQGDVVGGHPQGDDVGHRQVAQQFVDGARPQRGVLAQAGQLVGVAQQRQGRQRDHVAGGLVPGVEGDADLGEQGAAGDLPAGQRAGGQAADQVVPGVGGLLVDEPVDQAEQVGERCVDLLLGAGAAAGDGGDPAEEVQVLHGDAEQPADDGGGDPVGELADQVGRGRPGEEAVGLLGADLLEDRKSVV